MIFSLFLSTALLYFSFPNYFYSYGFWPLAFLFAVPLFHTLSGQSFARRFSLGALFGLLFYVPLVQWLIPYSVVGYFVFVLALTIQPVIFAALYRDTYEEPINIFYVPALWVASEYTRTLLLNGFSWNLGHSQVFNVYGLQTANVLGSWGISFVLILVNYALYCAMRNYHRKFLALTAGTVLIASFTYGALSIHFSSAKKSLKDSVTVCAVQPNIDSRQKQDPDLVLGHIAEQIVLSQHCLAKSKPDLIIWPETAISSDFLQNPEMKEKMSQFTKVSGVPVLLGAVLWEKEKNLNSAVLFLPSGKVGAVYHKKYLVPFSEYVPSGGFWPVVEKLFGLKSFDFIPGQTSPIIQLPQGPRDLRLGAAICSEDTIGSFFRQISKQGAGLAVVLLNDGWFKHPSGLVMHGQNAIMHAAENRLPIVRVANTGWTSFIDKYGRVKSLKEPWFNTKAVVTYSVTPNREETLFNRIGDLFAVFCLAFVIINQLRIKNEKFKIKSEN